MTQEYSEKEIQVLLSGVEPFDCSDAVPLSYRRPVGAIKQASRILLGLECQCVAYAQWNKCDGIV